MTPFFGAAPQPVYGPTNGIYASGGGSSTYYGNNATPGGGGAGCDRQAGAAGGPNGTGANMNDGVANTGGGGGAGPGGDGGSGIVILRFPACASLSVSPGTNQTSTAPGGEKIATMKVTGTVTAA